MTSVLFSTLSLESQFAVVFAYVRFTNPDSRLPTPDSRTPDSRTPDSTQLTQTSIHSHRHRHRQRQRKRKHHRTGKTTKRVYDYTIVRLYDCMVVNPECRNLLQRQIH